MFARKMKYSLQDLVNFNIGDVDVIASMLQVNLGKGGKDRRVPIAVRTCQWIRRYLIEARPSMDHSHSGHALFLDRKGLRFRGHQLTKLVANCIQGAGVRQSGSCHLFRHSMATLMHENGADIRYIQEMLGHASIATTQVYTHVTVPRLREVYRSTHPAARNES
jgi:integrase/recombinase XerD